MIPYKNLRLLILNGPPHCGKDTIARRVLNKWQGYHLKFSEPLKDAVHAFLGRDCHAEFFNDSKDEALKEFYGRVPREVYIEMFGFAEAAFGADILGFILRDKIHKIYTKSVAENEKEKCIIVVTDCGRTAEVAPLVNNFHSTTMRLCRIHRKGHTFNKDIRHYIHQSALPADYKVHDVYNETQPTDEIRDIFLDHIIEEEFAEFLCKNGN